MPPASAKSQLRASAKMLKSPLAPASAQNRQVLGHVRTDQIGSLNFQGTGVPEVPVQLGAVCVSYYKQMPMEHSNTFFG